MVELRLEQGGAGFAELKLKAKIREQQISASANLKVEEGSSCGRPGASPPALSPLWPQVLKKDLYNNVISSLITKLIKSKILFDSFSTIGLNSDK